MPDAADGVPERIRLLLIEDNPGDAELVREMLAQAAPGVFEITQVTRLVQGLELMAQGETDVMLLDLVLPDSTGLDSFHALHSAAVDKPIVVFTGSHGDESGIQAVRAGAQDFLVKGQTDADLLARALRYAVERKKAALALRASEERYQGLVEMALAAAGEKRIEGLVYEGMISRHPQMLQALASVRKVADARVPVLVCGESGTGKELVAKALHESGCRRGGPFVVINCAAITETLLEAELFGVRKGTATGVEGRTGKFESADGGTIFLDEIGDMDPALQAKLLRFLQDGVVERVGGGPQRKVDVRVVAATNQDLEGLIQQGRFREDLYYRLNTVVLELPPLRGRTLDIRDFVQYFISKVNREHHRNIEGVSPAVMKRLVAYDWPGNIRELQHAIERAILMAEGNAIELTDLPAELQQLEPAGGTAVRSGCIRAARQSIQKAVATDVEKTMVLDCLEKAGWNVARAARAAGYSRVHLHRLMKKHGIVRPERSRRKSKTQDDVA